MKYNTDRLKYHAPDAVRRNNHEHIDAAFVELVEELSNLVPTSSDSTQLYRTIEEARMKAHLCVALQGVPMYIEETK